jgi:5,10-methylenetetrahydromethanopterin reductase
VTSKPQIWLHLFPVPGRCIDQAVWAESVGFDGVLLADSETLVGDPFVELAMISRSTTRLGLGTGVVNPVTRHAAVVAAAAATLHRESGGRAALGIGRGDSALSRVGLAQPTTAQLFAFVRDVRAYLHGEPVITASGSSQLAWLEAGAAPPPVEVAATGPKTIALAATIADRPMLTIGADPKRIAAGIDAARAARRAAGLDANDMRIGAYLNVACHNDAATARDLVRGSAAIFARFSSRSRSRHADPGNPDDAVIRELVRTYDPARHGETAIAHARSLPDDFVDRFAVVGPPTTCIDRINELIDLGLDRIVVVPGSRDADPAVLDQSNAMFAEQVLPHLADRAAPRS